ncbi:TetR family transcriptional regulator [Nocardia abscessus]|uniref:TetR family transcriptional regulator n=1 Tax=Nocardia abscessus TaxID=120957 RepID=UPI002455C56D|nr:TetR family transcriptional regulator [Nocardia abscessus]
MAEITRDLGVTRQTVYRYFANAGALLAATALAETGQFLDILAAHLGQIPDPADAVVEGIAYTLECLPGDRYLSLLLTPGRSGTFSAGVTSDTALAFGRSILERFAVDWDQAGIDSARLDELVEYMLRIVQSFVLDPGRPPRRGAELRAFSHHLGRAGSAQPPTGAPPSTALTDTPTVSLTREQPRTEPDRRSMCFDITSTATPVGWCRISRSGWGRGANTAAAQ